MSQNSSDFVRKHLIAQNLVCARHCSEPATFSSFIEESDRLVGAYLCPSNYISRVVYFSSRPDSAWFENFLREDLGGGERVRSKDIRKATRHGWELGRDAESEASEFFPKGLTEYYWTFYPASDEEKKNGNFVCVKCHKFFVKPKSSPEKICPRHN